MEKYPLLGEKDKDTSTFKKQWPQHLAAITVNIIAFSSGCVSGWSAPAIPQLQGNLGSIKIMSLTSQQVSWIGSIHTLGAALGSLPAGQLAGKFGRKLVLLSLAIPMIIGWFIILYGFQNVNLIYLGRFICGLPFGAMGVVAPMYNNEIAEDNVRGVVGVYFDVAWCAGILWAYVIGAYFSFFWLTLSCCLPPCIFILTFVFMPESPVFLLMKNKQSAAEEVVRWFRRGEGKEERTAAEMKKLQEMLFKSKGSLEEYDASLSRFESVKLQIKDLTRSTSFVAILIAFGLMTCQKLSGVSAIIFYAVDIFREANTNIAPESATIILGTVCLLSAFVSVYFIDRIGRRTLLIVSGAAMSVSLAVMSAYSALIKYNDYSITNLHWIPILMISGYIGFFGLGFGPIPWFMIDELLPKKRKQWEHSVVVCYNCLLAFVVAKSFGPLVESFGYPAIYAIYAFGCVISVLFIQFCVPETSNKSFSEINKELSRLLHFRTYKSNG